MYLLPKTKRIFRSLIFATFVSTLLLGLSAQATVIFNVSKQDDSAVGPCALGATDCSLREAVMAANELSEPSIIYLTEGTFSFSPNLGGANEDEALTGDLDLYQDITIEGAGADKTIIDAKGLDRVFDIPVSFPSIKAFFKNLTIRNGKSETSAVPSYDQLNGGGGIRDQGTARLRIENCVIENNTSDYEGGGVATRSKKFEIVGSTIHGNQSHTYGGGVFSYFHPSFLPPGVKSKSVFTNSTLSDNHAELSGGGLYNNARTVFLSNVTIFSNEAGQSGGGVYAGSTDQSYFGGVLQAQNTIISHNTGENCGGGLIKSSGFNLENEDSCKFDHEGDLINTNPKLDHQLAYNQGTTLTHALLVLSPAVDAGNPDGCFEATGYPFSMMLKTDQRGMPRATAITGKGTPRCDIGAFEYMGYWPETIRREDPLYKTPLFDPTIWMNSQKTSVGIQAPSKQILTK